MRALGVEMLSALGLPPLELVALSADLGCQHISTGLNQMPAAYNPLGHADWSLRDDAALRREMIALMADRGVSISLGEGFAIRPGASIRDRAGDMDLMAELGARGLGAVSMEADQARAADELALLADMAAERDMLATIEFAPGQAVATLDQALAMVRHVARPTFGLLVDAMHLFRSGSTVADLAAINPAHILYAQLCDAPAGPPGDAYMGEAMFARRAPGDGELPLADFVAALPADIPIGLEVPNLAAAQAGQPDHDRIGRAVAAARALIS